MHREFLTSEASPPTSVAVVLPGEQALGEQENKSFCIWYCFRKGIVHYEFIAGQQPGGASRDRVRLAFLADLGRC